MRGDEYPLDALPLNFEDCSFVFGSPGIAGDFNQAKPDNPLESSTQPTVSVQSVPSMIFAPLTIHTTSVDTPWQYQSSSNSLSTLSYDSIIQSHNAACESTSPDFYSDLFFSDSSSIFTATSVHGQTTHTLSHSSHHTTPKDEISLSPLHFTHSRSRSTSPDIVTSFRIASRHKDESQLTDGGTDGAGTDGAGTTTSEKVPRHRRPAHKRAEAKRRIKIQGGLERLTSMVPSNVESSGGVCKSKKSKAAVLRKSADYCRRLMTECNTMLAEADALRAEMQALTADIKRFQEALPAEGMVPMTPGSSIPIDQMFSNYVQTQSLSKWKFWIFGRLTRPLFESFNRVVSISSIDAFRQSSVHWMRDYLSLVALRPVLLTGLRELVTSTSIMTNPERLECEVRTAILQESGLIAVTPAAATVTGPMPSSSTVAVSRQR